MTVHWLLAAPTAEHNESACGFILNSCGTRGNSLKLRDTMTTRTTKLLIFQKYGILQMCVLYNALWQPCKNERGSCLDLWSTNDLKSQEDYHWDTLCYLQSRMTVSFQTWTPTKPQRTQIYYGRTSNRIRDLLAYFFPISVSISMYIYIWIYVASWAYLSKTSFTHTFCVVFEIFFTKHLKIATKKNTLRQIY